MSAKEQMAEQMARATRMTFVQPGKPLALLVDALRARDWTGAAKQLDALTREMSLRMTEEERSALAAAVTQELETAALLDSGPPAAPVAEDIESEDKPKEPRHKHRKRVD